jgi:hypothetical protein
VALVGLLVAILSFVLYVPVVVVSGPERLVANRFVEPLGGAELVRDLTTSLARTWSLWNRDLPWPAVLLLVVGVGLQSAQDLRQRRAPLALLAVGVSLGLVLVQRVAPFERVWLFLLPVYYVEGIAGLVRLFGQRMTPLARVRPARLGVVLLGAALAAPVLASGSIPASQETGAFPDAPAVVASLRGRVADEDAVLTTVPASLPELQFYFRQAGLPTASLVTPPATARRLFVVAPAEPAGLGLPAGEWQPPVEEARFSGSVLYRLDRA